MPDLNIKNAETYRLARELAAATGESMTQAVTEALRERLDRIQAERSGSVEARAARIMELGKVLHDGAPPGYWDQDFDELLYDDLGLPK
jgi:antitoxin VapB